MTHSLPQSAAPLPATPWGFLPPRLKVLFITGNERTGRWLAEALAQDSATQVQLEEITGVAAGLARLRDEVFDAVLLSHAPPELDALDFLEVLRTGSHEQQPLIVLGAQAEQDMAAICYEAGADAYLCIQSTTTRTLIWQVARAVQRQQVLEENRRLAQAQRHQLQREHEEARRLLGEQMALTTASPASDDAIDGEFRLPQRLVEWYRDLLRTHIIMGSGHLHAEMQKLAELLAAAGCPPRDALRLHTTALEEAIAGLGSRSARHVMNRADLLAIELVMQLAECYRQSYRNQIDPPKQLVLPGFGTAAA
jgi:DNA-binding response OmpR family regulator